MAVDDIMESMRARMPWSVASQVLNSLELRKSMGWRRTVEMAREGDAGFQEAEGELRLALEEHLLCGEKLVHIYHLEEADMDQLREQVRGLQLTPNPFADAFPVLLKEGPLREFRGHRPYIAAVSDYDGGTALALASTRYIMTREPMLPAELPQEAASELSEYEEIICVKHKRLEAIDVLWIPDEGSHFEIRTDFPLGMHIRTARTAMEVALDRFREILGPDAFQHHVNLFPTISSLYAAQGDGRMIELGFMVSGSSQKLERTRRDVECCREEAYHLGGVEALATPIQPYRTSVMWQVPIAAGVVAEPEATLRGISADTADPAAFLGELVMRNCTGFADYDHAMERILANLP